MDTALRAPDAVLVREACEQFDRENETSEKALAELFAAYPGNDNASHVLLKVVALNSLYSTRILAVLKLANHIAEQGAQIDAALAAGSAEAVEVIAGAGQIDLTFYSFATKYCNWHNPGAYPIYDSRVDKYLWGLKKQGLFSSEKLAERGDMWSYPAFCEVMTAFRNDFGLGAFSFKEIDKFLWSQGEAIWAMADEGYAKPWSSKRRNRSLWMPGKVSRSTSLRRARNRRRVRELPLAQAVGRKRKFTGRAMTQPA